MIIIPLAIFASESFKAIPIARATDEKATKNELPESPKIETIAKTRSNHNITFNKATINPPIALSNFVVYTIFISILVNNLIKK